MIIGIYGFLSDENNSYISFFITTINSKVAEASTCTMKYFSEASVLGTFLTLDVRGINNIRLISSPIHAPTHEFEDTDTIQRPTKYSIFSLYFAVIFTF
jgi:hypothetical protein